MTEIPEHLYKPYDASRTEERIYGWWEEQNLFHPETCEKLGYTDPDKEPFSIVLPPPNVTGVLHMGHALTVTIEDIVVRYQRMQGRKTLWLPGTDHAAIATQSKVEKELEKKKIKKHEIGREEFLRHVEEFAQNSHDTIVNQLKAMGASLDWEREAFTLDEQRMKAVYTAFKRMYDDGLIYRGERVVNWDPKMRSTVADDEIEYEEEAAPFYYFKYGPFTIGTARPETKFGDKYVVMHPDDERYADYEHGQQIELEWINGPITATVIKDEAIDMEFGSGVMTITPAHSGIDFEIAQRHNLDREQIIDERGRLLPITGEFEGLKIEEARPKIVEKLREKGLLVDIDEKYTHRVAKNYRGGGTIEPQIMQQWFVDVDKEFSIPYSAIDGIESGQTTTLKELMRKVVENGQVRLVPNHYEKTYYHWIDKLNDWCISRQIWYGHRIPVWYRKESEETEVEVYVGVEAPEGEGWEQDPDTLDTWFSSGLWTFSTLGWPDACEYENGTPRKSDDLATYHPTTLLETGHDILFFWVARMVLMSTYHLGEIPFETVYLHGLVRDENNEKMSKSKGNVIDPLDTIEKYGTDALRMALVVGNTPGTDLPLSEDKIKAYKHFANKIWNASRFVLENAVDANFSEKPDLTETDREYIREFEETVADITADLEAYRLHLASEKIYQYFWHRFADVVIEEAKTRLYDDEQSEKVKQSARWTLLRILTDSLKVLHPFMPFVTEELWSMIPATSDRLLMVEPWPHAE